ncbi:MAG: autotransporter-associated beta strand repeat-containing protein [Opitutae bacterium]|nr:autotransporter-associated beta strand repeat-containing protein [Opitutae bacterium]
MKLSKKTFLCAAAMLLGGICSAGAVNVDSTMDVEMTGNSTAEYLIGSGGDLTINISETWTLYGKLLGGGTLYDDSDTNAFVLETYKDAMETGGTGGTVTITGGGTLKYNGFSGVSDTYYGATYLTRNDGSEDATEWTKSLIGVNSDGIYDPDTTAFSGTLKVTGGTTLLVGGYLSQFVGYYTVNSDVVNTGRYAYVGVQRVYLEDSSTISFRSATKNLLDTVFDLGDDDTGSTVGAEAVRALNFLVNVTASAYSTIELGTDAASSVRLVVYTDSSISNASVGILSGTGRIYFSGGTISILNQAVFSTLSGDSTMEGTPDPETLDEILTYVHMLGDTYNLRGTYSADDGSTLADVYVSGANLKLGSSDGTNVVNNVLATATAVQLGMSSFSSVSPNMDYPQAAITSGTTSGTTDEWYEARANYFAKSTNGDLTIYGTQVLNNLESLFVERAYIVDQYNDQNGYYELTRPAGASGTAYYDATGSNSTIYMMSGSTTIVNQSKNRDGVYSGYFRAADDSSSTVANDSILVKTGEGTFVNVGTSTGNQLLNRLYILEGKWISSIPRLESGRIIVGGTGEFWIVVNDTRTFNGRIEGVSDLVIARSSEYTETIIDDEGVETTYSYSGIMNDDREYMVSSLGINGSTTDGRVYFTQAQSFAGDLTVKDGITLIFGYVNGDALSGDVNYLNASIFSKANSITLAGTSSELAQLNIGSYQIIAKLQGEAGTSAVALSNFSTIVLAQNDSEYQYTGAIYGAGSVVKFGSVSMSLGEDSSSYTGATVIMSGPLALNKEHAITDSSGLVLHSGVTVSNAASPTANQSFRALIGESGTQINMFNGNVTVGMGAFETASIKESVLNVLQINGWLETASYYFATYNGAEKYVGYTGDSLDLISGAGLSSELQTLFTRTLGGDRPVFNTEYDTVSVADTVAYLEDPGHLKDAFSRIYATIDTATFSTMTSSAAWSEVFSGVNDTSSIVAMLDEILDYETIYAYVQNEKEKIANGNSSNWTNSNLEYLLDLAEQVRVGGAEALLEQESGSSYNLTADNWQALVDGNFLLYLQEVYGVSAEITADWDSLYGFITYFESDYSFRLTAANIDMLSTRYGITVSTNGYDAFDAAIGIYTSSDYGPSFDGVISGTGTLEKIGTESLILTGVNTYTGATFVKAGELRIDWDAIQNSEYIDITNGALLTIVANTEEGAYRTSEAEGSGFRLDYHGDILELKSADGEVYRVNADGYFTDEGGNIRSANYLVNEQGYLVDTNGNFVLRNGEHATADGYLVNADGVFINDDGEFMDADGYQIDEYGNYYLAGTDYRVDADGNFVDENGKVVTTYYFLNASGYLVNKEGKYIDATGTVISTPIQVDKVYLGLVTHLDANGNLVDVGGDFENVNGTIISDDGYLVDANHNYITTVGSLVDSEGRLVDTNGNFYTTQKDAYKYNIDSEGRFVDSTTGVINTGYTINPDGYFVDAAGKVATLYYTTLKTEYSANAYLVDSFGNVWTREYKVDSDGNIINAATGEVVTTDYTANSDGKILDKNGNVVDGYKVVLDEEDSNYGYLVDSDGYRVTKYSINDRNLIVDENGKPVEEWQNDKISSDGYLVDGDGTIVTNYRVSSDGYLLDGDGEIIVGYKIETDKSSENYGKFVDENGNPIDTDYYIDSYGRLRNSGGTVSGYTFDSDNGYVVDSDGNVVSKYTVSSGVIVDQTGDVVTKYLVSDGYLVDTNGNYVTKDGYTIDSEGYFINSEGKRVSAEYHADADGYLVNSAGENVGYFVDENGNYLTKDSKYTVDSDGHFIDSEGNIVTEKYLSDADGYLVDADGKYVDASGNVLGDDDEKVFVRVKFDHVFTRVEFGYIFGTDSSGYRTNEAGELIDANGNLINDGYIIDADGHYLTKDGYAIYSGGRIVDSLSGNVVSSDYYVNADGNLVKLVDKKETLVAKYRVNSDGYIVDKNGAGDVVYGDYHANADGYFVDADDNVVTTDYRVNEDGYIVDVDDNVVSTYKNDNGFLVGTDGSSTAYSVNSDGYLVDNVVVGYYVNSEGYLVNASGALVDVNGDPVATYTNASGETVAIESEKVFVPVYSGTVFDWIASDLVSGKVLVLQGDTSASNYFVVGYDDDDDESGVNPIKGAGTILIDADSDSARIVMEKALANDDEDGNELFTGSIIVGKGTLVVGIEDRKNFSPDVYINTNSTFEIDIKNEDEALKFSGSVSGSGTFVKSGTGSLEFTDGDVLASRTSSVSLDVEGGEMKLDLNGIIDSTGEATDGIFRDSSTKITVAEGATFTLDVDDTTYETAAQFTGGGIFRKSGSGTLILNRGASSGIALTAATEGDDAEEADSGTLGAWELAALEVVDGGTLEIAEGSEYSVGRVSTEITYEENAMGGLTEKVPTLEVNGTLVIAGDSEDSVVEGALSGSGTVVKGVIDLDENGEVVSTVGEKTVLTLSGNIEDFTGTILLNTGTIEIVSDDDQEVSASIFGNNYVTTELDKKGSGTVSLSGAEALDFRNVNINVYEGTLSVDGDALVKKEYSDGSATKFLNNVEIAAGATFALSPTGSEDGDSELDLATIVLSGAGTFALDGGTILLSDTDNCSNFTGTFYICDDTVLELGSDVHELSGIGGTGTLKIAEGVDDFLLTPASDSVFTGTIEAGSSDTTLTVAGAGRLILSDGNGGNATLENISAIYVGNAATGIAGNVGIASSQDLDAENEVGIFEIRVSGSSVAFVDEIDTSTTGATQIVVADGVSEIGLLANGQIDFSADTDKNNIVAGIFNLSRSDVEIVLSNYKDGTLTLTGLSNIDENVTLATDNGSAGTGTLAVQVGTGKTDSYAGTISGSGNFEKTGGGKLTITADSHSYTGTTTVSNGILVFESETSGKSQVTLSSSALIVKSGATISGGIKLVAENSSLVFSEGDTPATYAVDLTKDEFISYNGTISGILTLEVTADATKRGVAYTVIKYEGTGEGSSDTVETEISNQGTPVFFDEEQSVGGNFVVYVAQNNLKDVVGVSYHDGLSSFLDLMSKWARPDSSGHLSGTEAQKALGAAINKTSNGSLSTAMTNLSPLGLSSMITMPHAEFQSDIRTVSGRLEQRLYDNLSPNSIWAYSSDWEVFAQASSSFVSNDKDNDTMTYDYQTYGVLAGADIKFDEQNSLGVAVAYDYDRAHLHNGGGRVEAHSARAMVFAGSLLCDYLSLNYGAEVGFAAYNAKRNTIVGSNKGDTTGIYGGIFADFVGAFELYQTIEGARLDLLPHIGASVSYYNISSYNESGSISALDIDSFDALSVRARFGVQLNWQVPIDQSALRVALDLSYSLECCDKDTDIDAKMLGEKFGVTAKTFSESVFTVTPGVSYDFDGYTSVYLNYEFMFTTDSEIGHTVSLGFRHRF